MILLSQEWIAMLFTNVVFLASGAVISGNGEWKYEYMPSKLALPGQAADSLRLGNGHGLCKDKEGNIYFTFDPAKTVSESSQVLAKYSPDGETVVMLGEKGPAGLARGVPHGLRIEHDEKAGESFLYHANNDATVFKTTLDGRILWTANFSNWKTEKPHFWPYKPTDAIVVPGTDVLLVADGYGSSYVHKLDKNTGAFLEGQSFGGKGATLDPLELSCPHGINLDPTRPGTFRVSDRANHRFVWVTPEGKAVDSHRMDMGEPGQELPCNVDFYEDQTGYGTVKLVPGLGTNKGSNFTYGNVGIYGKDEEVLAVIEVARTIGHLGHQHPHDAIFLPNGDVVVCCWAGPSDPGVGQSHGTISYWRRLPPMEVVV
jgi:hypothetical protein